MSNSFDGLFTGVNAAFVQDVYDRFLADPDSVDREWRQVFGPHPSEVSGPDPGAARTLFGGDGAAAPVGADALRSASAASIRARVLLNSYRMLGHLEADLDPLDLWERESHPDLDYRSYGFTDAELDAPIFLGTQAGLPGRDTASLREILDILQEAYCSTIGVEYMHIQSVEERTWLQRHFEERSWRDHMSDDERLRIYRDLVQAESFESFLHIRFPATKRFGLDGGESAIPCIEQLLLTSALLGVEEVVIGMAHRGRLNVLARTLEKPRTAIFAEFQGTPPVPDHVQGSGDVKYHLGSSADRTIGGRPMHLTLTANPSHLEAVNPVVLGKVRAKQNLRDDEAREKVTGLLIHGDAAFCGQGIVPESLDLSQLRGYRTGGTLHLVINNQIGFTANPTAARSTPYPTDVAKGFQMPIFHVNGDDPDAVVRVAHLAAAYRHRFKKDVVVDLVCYRRHGHNEADEPRFTQPLMYQAIESHPSTRELYRERLIREEVLTTEEADSIEEEFRSTLDAEFEASESYEPEKGDWLEGRWKGLSRLEGEEEHKDHDTSVSLETLTEVGLALSRVPDEIDIHPKLVRLLDARREMVKSGEGLDWAMAEALAYGTLLLEGSHVRLSGQDSARGTFSHRHATLLDQTDERRYYPLSEIEPGAQGKFEIMDSPLSEFAVLGFEYGYSLADPFALVLWEAQFGDFANTAQVIFDQFLSAGEAKWLRMSGIVLLLPHGYEGQGPEHSSARLERHLQQCAQDNMQVVSCTTPANFFHALRRQLHRNYRKPLILMSPKSLLRHKLVVSSMADLGPGTRFRRVIGEIDDSKEGDVRRGKEVRRGNDVRRVLLCSGKVFYDLLEARRADGRDDVAIVRVEQLYPWPRDGIARELARYPEAEVVWCQEEPANMGAWNFVMRRLQYILDDESPPSRSFDRPIYVGRPSSASPATGTLGVHRKEQALLVEQALAWSIDELRQPFQRIPEPPLPG